MTICLASILQHPGKLFNHKSITMKDYTIDKVNWNTKRGKGHVLRNAIVYSYFRSLLIILNRRT